MRVGIIQSNYLPWRGYFDLINRVDLFLFHDDVQYTKGDWRNRNRLRTAQGLEWITVPVHHTSSSQRIEDTRIDYSRDWQSRHLNLVRASYGSCAGYSRCETLLERAFEQHDVTISELNVRLIRAFCDELGIDTPLRHASELACTGSKTEKLVQLLAAVGATRYLSGPAAKAYLDERRLAEIGVSVDYMDYRYDPYPQAIPGFEGQVSIVDFVANCGDEARGFFKRRGS